MKVFALLVRRKTPSHFLLTEGMFGFSKVNQASGAPTPFQAIQSGSIWGISTSNLQIQDAKRSVGEP